MKGDRTETKRWMRVKRRSSETEAECEGLMGCQLTVYSAWSSSLELFLPRRVERAIPACLNLPVCVSGTLSVAH